jgi:hypothetical protein
MSRFVRSASIAALGMSVVLGVPVAQATVITFQASGSDSDGALAGSATFTTHTGFIDITLSNLLTTSTFHNQGQALSDLVFTLSNAPGTHTGDAASGQLGNIASSGAVTYTSGSPARFLGEGPLPPDGQGSFSISGNTITMEAIGGGQPSQMIVPFVADGGGFASVVNGITNFNPYTIGLASFKLDLSGVTENTTVLAASFSFGTGPDISLADTVCTTCGGGGTQLVPEPTSLLVLGSSLLILGLITSRRRRQR